MPVEDDWEMEPCLRSSECEPQRSGFDWKCGFCGVEMQMMRVIRPEPPPTAEELAARKAQAAPVGGNDDRPEPGTGFGAEGEVAG